MTEERWMGEGGRCSGKEERKVRKMKEEEWRC